MCKDLTYNEHSLSKRFYKSKGKYDKETREEFDALYQSVLRERSLNKVLGIKKKPYIDSHKKRKLRYFIKSKMTDLSFERRLWMVEAAEICKSYALFDYEFDEVYRIINRYQNINVYIDGKDILKDLICLDKIYGLIN